MNTNVDHSEIEKFSALAKQWWDAKGPMRPLHELNPVRLNYVKLHVDLQDKSVADVGCGGGILSEALAKAGASVTGIDMSEDALHVAREHAESAGLAINYQHTTIEVYASAHPQSVDAVTCMELLEHVPDPASLIQACADLVKPGGYVFFSTLNRTSKAYVKAILGAEYLLRLLPKGTHDYHKFIRPSELNEWAQQADLRLHDISGLSYQPLSHKAQLSTNTSVNYICAFQRR